MWLGKFLDLTEDIKSMTSEIKKTLFKEGRKKRLTPLEFTILEKIFSQKSISGYDIIQILNDHFAGTWNATSGTIYPILSKLKAYGFLKQKTTKSPLGPLKKVYYLTEAGEELLKFKVNKNFLDQLKFVENFLIELSTIYLQSLPEEAKKDENVVQVRRIVRETLERVLDTIEESNKTIKHCPECNAEIIRGGAVFCALCGTSLNGDSIEEGDFNSAQEIPK